VCASFCRNPDDGERPWCCTKERCVDSDRQSWDYCDVCARPPSPPPSPQPPPPSPPPPACQLELSQQSQCDDQGANVNTCSDYFYEKNGEYKQCKWAWWMEAPRRCVANGFPCKPEAQGCANCKCPSVCPYEITKGQCYNQDADENTCSNYFYSDDGAYKQCEWDQGFPGSDSAKCRGRGPICEREREHEEDCYTCLPRSPSPSPPSPPAPPPMPPPVSPPSPSPPPPSPQQPACQLELSQVSQCLYQEGANENTCSDYFYEKNGGYQQCKWAWYDISPVCVPNGFTCNPMAQGTAQCNCPSVCPFEITKGQCEYQGANQHTCSDYYYYQPREGEGVYRQCKWGKNSQGEGSAKCRGSGPICEREKEHEGDCYTCLSPPSPPSPPAPPPMPPPISPPMH